MNTATEYITRKVLTKRDGTFKAFQYEVDGKIIRKSKKEYNTGWRYILHKFGEPSSHFDHWTFGKRPDSFFSKHDRLVKVQEYPVKQVEA